MHRVRGVARSPLVPPHRSWSLMRVGPTGGHTVTCPFEHARPLHSAAYAIHQRVRSSPPPPRPLVEALCEAVARAPPSLATAAKDAAAAAELKKEQEAAAAAAAAAPSPQTARPGKVVPAVSPLAPSSFTVPTLAQSVAPPVRPFADAATGLLRDEDSFKLLQEYVYTLGEDAAKAGRDPYDMLTDEDIPGAVKLADFGYQVAAEGVATRHEVEKYRKQVQQLHSISRAQSLPAAQRMLLGWYTPLVDALTELMKQNSLFDKGGVGPYLAALSPPELAVLTMHTLFGLVLHEPSGVKFISAVLAIGRAVDVDVKVATVRSHKAEWRGLVASSASSASKAQGEAVIVSPAGIVQPGAASTMSAPVGSASHFQITPGNMPEILRRAKKIRSETWSNETLVRVGSVLMSTFMKIAGMPRHLLTQTVSGNQNETADSADTACVPSWSREEGMDTDSTLERPSNLDHLPDDDELAQQVDGEFGAETAAATTTKKKKKKSVKQADGTNADEEFVPAIFHYYQHADSKERRVGMVRADARIVRLVSEDPSTLRSLLPKFNPMVVPPKKWTSSDNGGYLTMRHRVVRSSNSALQADVVRSANLTEILECVNYLGSVPWNVNEFIWRVARELWDRGGGVADIPSRTDKTLPSAADRRDRAAVRVHDSVKMYNLALHSQRCELRYKFAAAEEYSGKQIYYPYFLDFRGRAYPIPPYLNHTGGDLSRGLLTFATPRALGERGLYWLMVQVASLYGGGVDKESYAKRVEWTEERVALFARCVENPHEERFWLTADKPFQFLAAAHELVAALRSPDPRAFMSTLPVHTDGSCNGLQHYAALGRDAWGGASVNLIASDRPQDVYAAVLTTVLSKLRKEAADPQAHHHTMAKKLLTIGVSRKVVKQAVMTSVYGVTLIGARAQILARLLEMPSAVEAFQNSPERESLHTVALYLAKLTLTSLYDAFSGARRIQTWLGDCATLMAHVQQPVAWVSPVGLPIIQPYRAAQMHTVTTALQSVSLAEHSDSLPVSSTRQKNAFAPNFIHSLDASHMMRTAANCKRRGIQFASVHDSFWTHPADMDQLAEALREEFVRLYEQPILEQTRNEWVARFPELAIPALPQRGELDIREVLKSPYFFN